MTFYNLTTWTDFDNDGEPLNATVIGLDGEPIAIVLAGNHHDEFSRLALAAPELLKAAQRALDFIQSLPYEPSNAFSTKAQDALVDAIAKAKGE